MCELLGMSFNQFIEPSLSFRGFRKRGKDNPHGWGLAYYPDNSVQVIKEPIKATKSSLSEFIESYSQISSKIFIAHVRYASVGEKKHKNTHPFQRELNGKEFVFAHNGTLSDNNYMEKLNTGRFKPIGDTDSEYSFLHILNSIEERKIDRWSNEHFIWLWDQLKTINSYGSFNCIFSDGKYLFCYYDKNGYNGLCFVQRKAPFDTVRLVDEDFEINLLKEKNQSQRGFIIATNRLTNERWENFFPGELIVFNEGDMVFSSSGRDNESFRTSLNEKELKILKLLRESPHKVRLEKICQALDLPKKEITPTIHSLLCKGFIKQDSQDEVKWDHNDATYYTEPSKREEIDRLI